MNISFNEGDVWNMEGIVDLSEGSTEVFTATYWSAVTGTPTLEALKNGQTVTSTIFPSGAVTPSDRTVIFKPAVFAAYGNFILVVTATVGTHTTIRKVHVRVQKKKATR